MEFKEKLAYFNELVMFKHSIFSLPFIFIAMVVAADGWFGWYLLIMGSFAAISARNFAMGVNRYVDRDIDAQNPRTKNRPSVDGRLDGSAILIFTVVNALVFIAVAYMINALAFAMSFPILLILGGYSYFKRFSSLAHLILGLSLALAPIAGAVAVLEEIPLWSVLLSCGVMFWVGGFDLLYSLQDIDFDKNSALYSIPSRYGADATMFISAIFHALTLLFWALFSWAADVGIWGYIALLLSAIMLWYEHILVRRDFTKIDRAFFTVNGYLGIIYFFLIVFDKALA